MNFDLSLTSFFNALQTNPFLQMALLAGFIASLTSGIIGSYIVVKRIVFISGSIAHSVLGGVGFCIWLKRTYELPWVSPFYGALFTAFLSALLMGWVHLKYREREDSVIAALWSTGMSLGVVFLALTPGYNVEMMSFLFGNILWTSPQDLLLLALLAAFLLSIEILFHRRFLAISFDPEYAAMQSLSVTQIYLLLLSMIAISVVLLMQVVGSILVITMLTIPAALASSFTHRLSHIMAIATLIGCLLTFIGFALSYTLNWPPGATISLSAAFFYLLRLLCRRTPYLP